MPKPKHAGPPDGVIDHLIAIHEENGTLDKLLASGIGDKVAARMVKPVGYMTGKSADLGWQPWIWEGGETVELLPGLDPASGLSGAGDLGGFIAFDGNLYFTATDATSGTELRKYDGTSISVVDVNPGSGSSNAGTSGFVEYGGKLYFAANDGGSGLELHSFDGTTVELVANINTGSQSSDAGSFGGFVEYNGALYFTATDRQGYELRKFDGSGVTLVADLNPKGSSSAGVYGFVEFGGNLYFTANDGATGLELRRFDGTSVTTVDIRPGGASSSSFAGQFGGYIEFDGNLYFTAHDGLTGFELRKFDGTTVTPVADINEGPDGSSAGLYGFVAFNGALYFTARDSENGTELRKYDGATVTLIDLNSGSNSSHAGSFGGFVVFDGDLYFTADDGASGYELHRIDGVTGAMETFDFLPGPGGSRAQPIGIVGDSLAIGAWIDDRYVMLAATGKPLTTADFTIVDDGSGSFEPGTLLHVSDGDLLA